MALVVAAKLVLSFMGEDSELSLGCRVVSVGLAFEAAL